TTALNPLGGLGVQSVVWTATNAPLAAQWIDGTYTLTVHSEDVATNYSPNKSTNFLVDNTPPTINIVSALPDPAKVGNVVITVTASDTLSGVASAPTITVQQNGAVVSAPITFTTCSSAFPLAGGASVSCVFTYTVTAGPDGVATIRAYADDRAG